MQPLGGYEGLTAPRLLRALGGDRELLLEIIELFEREAPSMLIAVRRHAEDANPDALAQAAHVLKGSVANFGKSPLYEVAGQIERCAFAGDLSQLSTLLPRFDSIAGEFMQALARLRLELRS